MDSARSALPRLAAYHTLQLTRSSCGYTFLRLPTAVTPSITGDTPWPLHALAVTRSGRYDGSYKGSYKVAAHDGEMGGRRAGGPWKLGEARPAVLAKALLE